jgi:outer membrane biosynthesis protein TonB
LILIGVFAVGIGAAIIARTHGDNTAQPVAAIEAAPIAPPPQPPPPPPPAVAATPPAPPKSHATPHASPKPHRVVQADPPAPVDPIPDAAPPPLAAPAKPHVSEVALLEQARASLRSGNAAAALALADNAAAQYPDGVLVEEREALAIEALIKLDRKADARAKWSQFASSYPHSNYRARLQHYF